MGKAATAPSIQTERNYGIRPKRRIAKGLFLLHQEAARVPGQSESNLGEFIPKGKPGSRSVRKITTCRNICRHQGASCLKTPLPTSWWEVDGQTLRQGALIVWISRRTKGAVRAIRYLKLWKSSTRLELLNRNLVHLDEEEKWRLVFSDVNVHRSLSGNPIKCNRVSQKLIAVNIVKY